MPWVKEECWWLTSLVFNYLKHFFSSLMSPRLFSFFPAILWTSRLLFSPAFFSFVLVSFFPSCWFSLIWPLLLWCLSPRSSLSTHEHTFFSLLPCKPLFSGTYFPSVAFTSGCFKIEEPLQQYQLHLLQAGPSSRSPCHEQPCPQAAASTPWSHKAPAEVQVGFTPLLKGGLNSAEPENAETEGNKTHKV